MNPFEQSQKECSRLARALEEALSGAGAAPGLGSPSFAKWISELAAVQEQVEDTVLRVGVVGSIKSGKSTFVNALFGQDFLKRGAGVVTSMVTRIRTGDTLSATLYFKSFDQINEEIRQALALFPQEFSFEDEPDIQNPEHRKELSQAMKTLGADRLVSSDARNMNAVILESFLEGFEQVKKYLGEEPSTHTLAGNDFPKHREFSGDETLAVFLEDILLTLPATAGADGPVEIADCQGSDSPNPLHLALIEQYLFGAHGIVYVVSSRTGLRRADMRFLSLIDKMGLLEPVLFVVNLDFSEHESLEDLKKLLARIKKELALFRQDPPMFAFSCLYGLLQADEAARTPREQARLQIWEQSKDLAEFSLEQNKLFSQKLETMVGTERTELLIHGPARRMKNLALAVKNWAVIHSDLLQKDESQAHGILSGIQREGENIERMRQMIRDTLDGALLKGKRGLGRDVDQFFDAASGDLAARAREVIAGHQVALPELAEDEAGFSHAVYGAFQDLKGAVDLHLAEQVNPEVVRFVRQEEKKIQELFNRISSPFQAMVDDTHRRYEQAFVEMGVNLEDSDREQASAVNVERVRKKSGMGLPPLVSTAAYGAAVRTEAVIRLGWYRFVKGIKKTLKFQSAGQDRAREKALAKAVDRMKKNTQSALTERLMDYKENLKFQYLYKIMDIAAEALVQELSDRFGLFSETMAQSGELLQKTEQERKQAAEKLGEVQKNLEVILRDLNALLQSG